MNKFKLEIQENGISVRKSTMLFDEDGNPVEVSNHRKAIGIGDYKSPEDFKAGVKSALAEVYGEDLAELVGENATVKQHRNVVMSNCVKLEKENARLQNKVDELEAYIAELTLLNQE